MMKKCLLITILFSSLCLLSAMAQNTKAASGKCNGDVEWTFDGRTLYISSLAPKKNAVSMPDYDLDGNLTSGYEELHLTLELQIID